MHLRLSFRLCIAPVAELAPATDTAPVTELEPVEGIAPETEPVSVEDIALVAEPVQFVAASIALEAEHVAPAAWECRKLVAVARPPNLQARNPSFVV